MECFWEACGRLLGGGWELRGRGNTPVAIIEDVVTCEQTVYMVCLNWLEELKNLGGFNIVL